MNIGKLMLNIMGNADYKFIAEAEIIKVNTAFLGAKLPKGTHEITIKYNTPWLHTGILLSITGLIFYLIIIYKERNNNEKNKRTISKI